LFSQVIDDFPFRAIFVENDKYLIELKREIEFLGHKENGALYFENKDLDLKISVGNKNEIEKEIGDAFVLAYLDALDDHNKNHNGKKTTFDKIIKQVTKK
jgi:hypothetical protein